MINPKTLELGRQFQDIILFDLNKRGISFSNYTSKKFQYEVGENTAGIEIKHDMKFRSTGNLFIEIETKTKNNDWIKSGIFRDDNSWLFLIGDEKKYWIFGKKSLQRMLIGSNLNPVSTLDSKGYLLPIKQADRFAERIIDNGE